MRGRLLLSSLAAVIAATPALAYKQPRYLAERPLEVAAGPRTTLARMAGDRVPIVRTAAFDRFRAAHGAWQATWDAQTGVPTRLWGEGIAASGAMADAAVAEAVARRVLGEQRELLAPGTTAADLVIAQNVIRAGVRSVVFVQRHRGLDVVGARVRFTFKHDRLIAMGSTASPALALAVPAARATRSTLAAKATAWIASIHGTIPTVLDGGDRAVVLPIRRDTGIEHRVVTPIRVDSKLPRARWTVYADAVTGEPVARRQELHFAEGTINYRVPPRYPTGGYANLPAVFATHTANGAATTSNASGKFQWTGTAAASVAPGLTGTYATIDNIAGAEATALMNVAPNSSALWDLSADEFGDAQLSAYVHANIAKQYALTLDPDLAWLHRPIVVHVNENDICNAYSELDDIYFLRAGTDGPIFCENSARISDILYHEFGHSLHGQTFGFDIDDALSEGISDYYGATITGDPATGTGWIVPDEYGVRHIDPADKEYRWPDDIDGDPHITGLIIAGALWDLRTTLRAQLGDVAGKAHADKIFYGVISRADDIPASYAEALVTDDDDGNLANGTPNKCAIDRAFGRHGLGELATATASAAPELDRLSVRLAQLAPTGTAQCAGPQIVSTKVTWELRSNPDTKGVVDLAMQSGAFAGALPSHTGEVIRYSITATLDDGATLTWPRNAADPQYEIYDGPVTPIYCTDFETDPVAAGWTLGGFEWGAPTAGQGTTDPSAGFTGAKLLGTGLAGAGDYAPESMLKALSPIVDVTGHTQVRLQYRRWLAVEDHYYDAATIAVDGTPAWNNAESEFGSLMHVDREWRFHDIDVSAAAADGSLQISFELTSDDYIELGGWSIDQFCIVAAGAPPPACGNGAVDGDEQCDDGNTTDGDGCSASCADETGGTDDEGGCCSADGGATSGSLLLGLATGLVLVRRRRRR